MADFSHAKAKLARAKKHIGDVEAEVNRLTSPDLYSLRMKSAERDMIEVVFESLHQPNQDLKLIVGDAISNMRSALDYAVVALTGEAKAQFPNADDANGLKGECAKGFVGQLLGEAAIAFFVEQIQAYKGGDGESIWALNKLRNIDKHRFLLTTVNIAAVTMSFRSGTNIFSDCTFGIDAGERGNFIRAPAADFQITGKPRASFRVFLTETAYIPREPIVDVLKRLSQSTENCIDALSVLPK